MDGDKPHVANGGKNVVDSESIIVDVFKWSCCKRPLPQELMLSIGIPLPLQHVERGAWASLRAPRLIPRIPATFHQQQVPRNSVHQGLDRWFCRTIWNGRTSNGRKLVSGLLEKNMFLLGHIFFPQISLLEMC
ncbi:uncharacterized protein LOC132614580 isoform X1 [Lycium barbarum]|uniref:uncharacterized protein LOC132614580 isoform X1 n=1 Tax=Lycium barbarum TaxID=112863 RepID=UPI00293E93AF|nr:uncharacterized protein LOC132614580 isoform X1 [Lycium barbarum]XP_060185037.1 uncharacterized protein LOC132614580 isoform X1 [Lycium barbarum]XP_060185038.1 uncharacterized protein LOC132614580 isoform X1 [Lycium barbarum]XP_060185039.1 uncharacterized protein LOC132614580 isoform X1 [Lycium barbarum]XP_060185040.1 uncharacterized protein LOC132614580 isoform X1 [Lycium barbarum]XP_060185041.1 uncharacterized protein LOC132614580 isoform X1 [Lycium barbarum]XP_060185042.1 uncharacterize